MAAVAYITRDELFAQTVPGDALSGLPNSVIDQTILWASSVADSYIRKRYMLPLVSWSEDLKANVAELCQWRLMRRRGIRPGSGNEELARMSYEDALAWFKSVARGDAEMDCVDSTPLVDEDGSLSEGDTLQSFRFVTGSGCAVCNGASDDCGCDRD